MQHTDDILVVDDEVNIVNLVVDLLQDEGYKVRSALNGVAALEAITERAPAMILMDMYMPQMTGMMLLNHLLQHGISDIPIVLMTASPRAAEQFVGSHMVDYLAKPFDIEQLLECVARHVPPPTQGTPPNNSAHSNLA